MVHYSVCPLCKSADITFALKCTDHLVTGDVFEVFRCPECGFMFTQDHPEESETARYYESESYIPHSNSRKTFFNKAYQFARHIMLNRKKNHVEKYCGLKTGSILDIGCGTGHFLNSMKMAGWNTEGVEINPKAGEYARSVFDLNVITPQEILSVPDKSIDCITLWHVLEHFHQPFNYFSEIKRIIKPEGKVIVALPNTDSYDSRYYGPHWAAYDVPRHLWHFNPRGFSRFASDNGFEVSSFSSLPLDVFYISILSEKYRGTLIPLASGIITGLLFYVLSLFSNLKNSSIIYVLAKSDN